MSTGGAVWPKLPYTTARPLRSFEMHGLRFDVVRWRDDRGKHWRGYLSLALDGWPIVDGVAAAGAFPEAAIADPELFEATCRGLLERYAVGHADVKADILQWRAWQIERVRPKESAA